VHRKKSKRGHLVIAVDPFLVKLLFRQLSVQESLHIIVTVWWLSVVLENNMWFVFK